jgi:hypothetical protein
MSDRLTATELATALRVKVCTIRAWQRMGIPYQPCGRLRFYSLSAVEDWLKDREARRLAQRQQESTHSDTHAVMADLGAGK